MEPTPLNNLLQELKRTTDKERYTQIMAEIEAIKIEYELAENAQHLEKEAREQAEFEAEKKAHLAQVEDLEIKKRFLANNERSMIENMITGLSLVKMQVETYADAVKLAKHINRDIEKFGTPEQMVEPIDLFGADLQWTGVARGLLDRVAELLHWNENHPDHFRTVIPENVKIYPTKWGEPQPDDEPPGADDIPEVDHAFFDVKDLNL